jgi:[acyl-carrier-protein] S-malonyltransferase
VVTERVVARGAEALGVTVTTRTPTEDELLPDATARLEIGSIAAAALTDPLARALFAHVTQDVEVSDDVVADYHARNPRRFAALVTTGGWRIAAPEPDLAAVRERIRSHLLGAARRRAFRRWLDERRAALVWLAPGYEHPGDPRQPDNTHKH